MSWLTQDDFDRWERGQFTDSYQKLGAHSTEFGTWFAVWAPYAEHISVIGDFNNWDPQQHAMVKVGTGFSGLWQVFVDGARPGQHYKYRVHRGHYVADKTDPFAFQMEAPHPDGNPIAGLSSIIADLSYSWNDADWMTTRPGPEQLHAPLSIYEVHLGSWQRTSKGYSLSYREIAEPLSNYVLEMGFTHIELMPVMEHPYYPSWGYQVVGYFSPTHRYGSPADLMYLIDYLHQRGIGVILDWVPAHFATDPQGLVYWDGSPLYEYNDPKMRFHPDWGTFVFDYNKPGVRNFLVSNACFWLDHYHIDGLRFDAVASMLYRDYSRDDWTPNRFGGRENLEAIDFLKQTNEAVYHSFPSALMIAEESTAWPKVSKPTYDGGLGFLYKWNMGWMHDTLRYMSQDPINRKFHQNDLTFSMVYAYSEHYALPLSHDEVVHGKGSLWGKMPGDAWQKAANLRLLFGHMYGHPGKKLLFMGGEFGQRREWNHDAALDWNLLDDPLHKGVQQWVKDLNALYRSHPALTNEAPGGFEWIDFQDVNQSVASYIRRHDDGDLVFVLNFTPVPRQDYRIGFPSTGTWRERLNSDATVYGGSGVTNGGSVTAEEIEQHGRMASAAITLPPLGVMVFEKQPDPAPKRRTAAKKRTTTASTRSKKTASKKAASTKAASTKAASTKAASTKAASTKAASTKAASTKAASTKTPSSKAASKKAVPQKVTPKKATPKKAASKEAPASSSTSMTKKSPKKRAPASKKDSS